MQVYLRSFVRKVWSSGELGIRKRENVWGGGGGGGGGGVLGLRKRAKVFPPPPPLTFPSLSSLFFPQTETLFKGW